MAVEAYYAGYIRTAHIQNDTVVTPCDANVTVIINAISVAHDNTATSDDGGIFNVTTGNYLLTPVDGNAIVFSETPSQQPTWRLLVQLEISARMASTARCSTIVEVFSSAVLALYESECIL